MGSDRHHPEERAAHRTSVGGFWMERTTVTNAQFTAFVTATGHITVAERPLDPKLYPDAEPAMLAPGALVFRMTDGPVDTRDISNWWHWTPAPSWLNPEGPGSDLAGRDEAHPEVHESAPG